jgi:hypothetical protein
VIRCPERQREQLAESLPAAELSLTDEDLTAIGAGIPADAAGGDRYSAGQMAELNSER